MAEDRLQVAFLAARFDLVQKKIKYAMFPVLSIGLITLQNYKVILGGGAGGDPKQLPGYL